MQNLQELHFSLGGGIVDVRRGGGAHSQKLYSAPLLPSTTSTHQCCYLWWPTFEPCDWSMQPITVQSETSTWVVGQTPPIRGHRGVWQTDRPKADVGVSSLFVDPLETDRHCRQIGHEYHHARQKFGARSRKSFISFVFLFELEGICCARFKSRVTLMSFQFCN